MTSPSTSARPVPARRTSWTATNQPPAAVLAVLVVAVAVALGAAWMLMESASVGLQVMVGAVLATAPVGLVLATPLPLRLARRRGSAVGLKIDEAAVCAADRVDTVVLDKSGTITTGELTVVAVTPVEPDDDRNLRWFAGALAHSSDHPVARAIARLAARGHLTDVVAEPGLGTSGSVDRHPVRFGRPDWIGFDHVHGDGITVAVEVDARALGIITVDEIVRDDATASAARLRAMGLDLVLVSDATAHNTERLASATGIEAVHAEATSEQRARVVTDLQATGSSVAFVGPPDDNAEALSSADLAVSSTPVGLSCISLDTLDAGVVAGVLSLARTTSAVIRSNRVIGVVTPVLGLGLAATGVLTPVLGLGFGLVSALLVVGNSLRLRTDGRLARPRGTD